MIERMKKTDKRTTETEQRKAERALADAGYMPTDRYVERNRT